MASISRLAWTLLALALLGATASLFGPAQAWWGLEVGSAGTALFGFALWAGHGSARNNPIGCFLRSGRLPKDAPGPNFCSFCSFF